jgi:hypothetical protein
MVVGAQVKGGRRYASYRCSNRDCHRPVSISASIVEDLVVQALKADEELARVKGRASARDRYNEAALALKAAQDALDEALRTFIAAGVQGEPAAVERLAELRAVRDRAQEDLDRVEASTPADVTVSIRDWHRLNLDERRALIRANIERVVVAPGRGADRVSIEFYA